MTCSFIQQIFESFPVQVANLWLNHSLSPRGARILRGEADGCSDNMHMCMCRTCKSIAERDEGRAQPQHY